LIWTNRLGELVMATPAPPTGHGVRSSSSVFAIDELKGTGRTSPVDAAVGRMVDREESFTLQAALATLVGGILVD
jgi:hypothetical protein